MSGVLNRMVARTRGDLPSVEPLAKPRFQPSSAEMPQESLLDKQERTKPNQPQRIDLQTRDIVAQTRVPQTSKPEEAKKPSHNIETKPPEQPAKKVDTMAAVAPVRPVREASPVLEREISSSSKSKDNAEPEEISVNVRRDSDEKAVALLQPAKSKLIDETASIITAKSQTSSEQDLSTSSAEEPPEIRISIGSIELQVAPREVRPRPASFRPRVSLDDFLNRSRG